MSTLQELLLRLALVKAIKSHADVVEASTKEAVKSAVGGRMAAAAAILPDGTEAATVSISKPTQHKADPGGKPYVKNPGLFLRWVSKVDRKAIVRSVRETDVPRLLNMALDVLETTGELPPGIELSDPTPAHSTGGGTVSVRQSDEQRANLIRAWQAGEIELPDVLPEVES